MHNLDQPWLANRQWANGRIKDGNLFTFIFLLLFSIFWNAISWTVAIASYHDGALESGLPILILLFPLIGLFLIGAAIRQGLVYLKYGTSTFELAEVPGVLGGSIGGVILTKTNIRPEDGFRLRLRCIHKYTRGSGKKSSTHRDTLWESAQTVDEEAMADDFSRSAIPVLFDIPYDAKPTAKIGPRAEHLWELEVTASTPGINYKATFVVPVFKTDKSQSDRDTRSLRESLPKDQITKASFPGIQISPGVGRGFVYKFNASHLRKFAIVPLIFLIPFAGAGVFLTNSGGVANIVGVGFLVFSILLATASLSLLRANLRLATSQDGLAIERHSLFSNKREQISAEDIASLSPKSSFKSGQVEFFDIELHRNNGTKIKVPTRIQGRSQIELLIARLESELGL